MHLLSVKMSSVSCSSAFFYEDLDCVEAAKTYMDKKATTGSVDNIPPQLTSMTLLNICSANISSGIVTSLTHYAKSEERKKRSKRKLEEGGREISLIPPLSACGPFFFILCLFQISYLSDYSK